MRVSLPILIAVLVCAVVAAPAQTVIGVEDTKAASPQVEDQSPGQPQQQGPAQQQDPQPSARSRYSFTRVENGFVRLDNETGQVAYCSSQTAGWACQAVPVDRSALDTDIARGQREMTSLKDLESEIARLRDEVASLRKEIASLKEPPPPRPPENLSPPSDKGGDVTVKLPTDEDIARARDFIEKTWRHLIEMIVTIQKDMMRKG